MTCTADSDYIRAVSVKYKRCPSSYSVRSAVARTGFEIKPLQRPKTAQQTVPSCAQPRAQTARAQREKTRVLEELMFFYGRGVHDSGHPGLARMKHYDKCLRLQNVVQGTGSSLKVTRLSQNVQKRDGRPEKMV